MWRHAKMNDNVPAPYLYNKYNITSHYTTKTTLLKNSLMQSLNSFIEGINKHRLPKHIIFMPDRDLLSPLRYKNRPGTSKAICKLLRWITNEIEWIIETKKESMFKICAGLVQGKQPNLIWVKALDDPESVMTAYCCTKSSTRFWRKQSATDITAIFWSCKVCVPHILTSVIT